MADNTRGGSQDAGDPLIATDEVTYSGDTADVQLVHIVGVTGAEGAKTVVDPTLPVSGDAAHDDADSGNPVKIGGKATDWTNPTGVAAGDRTDAWLTRWGHLVVAPVGSEAGSDAVSNNSLGSWHDSYGNGPVPAMVVPYIYNGTSWDRLRGDTLGLHISRQATAATATLSNVASSASSVTLLALNTARKGASIHNDSTQVLYVKFGTTASSTSYTVKMTADAHYEVPFGYTGRIDGIWASANGNARVTELT